MITLDALTREDVELARTWRNADDVRAGLRTPYVLTQELQAQFYDDVICNRDAHHRYWAVRDKEAGAFVGMTGLTDISFENGHAEISLLIDPRWRGKGTGEQVVELVLREAFERMRLLSVFAETYTNNPAIVFWQRCAQKYNGTMTLIPRRKFWDGKLYDAQLVTFVPPCETSMPRTRTATKAAALADMRGE